MPRWQNDADSITIKTTSIMGKQSKKEVETTTFTLNKVETARAQKFCEEHLKHARHMTAGEAFQFVFMPTMIGTVCSVRCLSCGAEENITDWDQF